MTTGYWIAAIRATEPSSLEREKLLLPALAAALPLPIPRFERMGWPDVDFPYPFVGYRKLPGVPLQNRLHAPLSARGRARVAPRIADFTWTYGFGGRDFAADVLARYGSDSLSAGALNWLPFRQLRIAVHNVAYGRIAGQAAYVASGAFPLERVLAG